MLCEATIHSSDLPTSPLHRALACSGSARVPDFRTMSLKVDYSDRNPPLVAAVTAKYLGEAVSFKVGKASSKVPLLTNADTGCVHHLA